MTPLVSILIPAYNAQEWITDTVKSALAQTWPRKEIVIVDDGSTDQTLAVAKQFACENVTVFSQKNQGAAAARNKAYSLCRGDYIQWLDADDLLAPDKIAKQLEALGTGGTSRTLLSSAWGMFIYRSNRAVFTPSPICCDLSPIEWMVRKIGQNLTMQTTAWLASRELTERAGPWNTQLLGDDDGEYFCRVVLGSDRVQFVSEARTFYRRGFNGLSYIGLSNKKLDAQLLSIKLHLEYIRSLEDSERVREACLSFLQIWLISFYPERPDIVEQLHQMAASLGGKLEIPRLSWKYAWIQKLAGWVPAKRAQIQYNRIKMSLVRGWDRALFLAEGGKNKAV